jgi:hypothetical protein
MLNDLMALEELAIRSRLHGRLGNHHKHHRTILRPPPLWTGSLSFTSSPRSPLFAVILAHIVLLHTYSISERFDDFDISGAKNDQLL